MANLVNTFDCFLQALVNAKNASICMTAPRTLTDPVAQEALRTSRRSFMANSKTRLY